VDQIGDTDLLVSTIVADTQRLTLDHDTGHAIHRPAPAHVLAAYRRVEAGYARPVIAHPQVYGAWSDLP
jgi:hypothetical protein